MTMPEFLESKYGKIWTVEDAARVIAHIQQIEADYTAIVALMRAERSTGR